MKKSKYILPILFLLSFGTVHSQSSNILTGGKGLLGLNSLNLSDAEKQELRTIFDEHCAEWQEMKKSMEGDYHRFQIVKKQMEVDLINALNPDQKAQYDALSEIRYENRKKTEAAVDKMVDEYRFAKKDKVYRHFSALTSKRTILDRYISNSDKATINELRGKLMEGIQTWKKGYENWQDKVEDYGDLLTDLISLRDLTDKYIDEISEIIQSDDEITDLFLHKSVCGGDNPFLSNQRAAIFLLLSTDTDFGAEEELKSNMNVFPNPVQDELTIDFYLPYAGDIQLVLSNEDGNTIKHIYSGYMEDGNHQIKVNTKELTTRSYILNLLDQTGGSVEKIIVTKNYDE